jgi:hypothetical protein
MTAHRRPCGALGNPKRHLSVYVIARLALLASVVLTPAAIASADANSIVARFRSEYPRASQHLEDVYCHSRVSATQLQRKHDGSGFVTNQLEFKSNGEFSAISATYKDGVSSAFAGQETVFLISPDGAYTLTRFPTTPEFSITGTSSPREFTETLRRDVLPVFGAFCIHGQRLIELINEPNFAITNSTEVRDRSGVSYRFEWTNTVNHPVDGKIKEYGWFVVSPDKSWALREYDFAIGTDKVPFVQSIHQTAELGETIDGAPIMKHVVFQNRNGERREESLYKEYDTADFRHEQIANNEFALAAYGIEAPHSSLYRWLIGLNLLIVLLFIAAFTLKRRATRLRESRNVK